jgi:AcrR family transcriptional regulator
VTRWKPDSAGRLQQAALALFAERGYENTTVAEIAARAGVTERTFFRHYADKREVLFGGSAALEELLVDAVAGAPPSAGPVEAAAAGLEAAAEVLQERREFARRRQAVIAATPELREREILKLTSWAHSVAEVLRSRGVEDPAASLAGELVVAAFRIAFERWVADDRGRALAELVRETLDQARALAVEERATVA